MNLKTWVSDYLRKHEIRDIELARKLGYEGNVQVSRVRLGDGHIPEDRISQWVEVLGLQGDEKEEFLKYAHLALATPWLRNWVTAREAELGEIRRLNQENQREIRELAAQLAVLQERLK